MRSAISSLPVLLGILILPSHAGVREVELTRDELAAALVNHRATVFTVDGRRTCARILGVNRDGLALQSGATPSIPYGAIVRIEMVEYVGNGRAIGMGIGGSLGLLAGLTGAGLVGIQGTGAGGKLAVALLGIGVMPAGALLGRWIGQQFDRQRVVIRLAP